MRIEWTRPVRSATPRRDDKGAVSDRTFTSALGQDPAATSGVKSTAAMTAVDGLLALQEVADSLGGRKRAMAHGEQLLDALDELRDALLTGTMPRARLAALVRLTGEAAPLADDPRLAEILGDIELRAAVELAKLDSF
jgi:hypothetical protein